MKNVGVPLTPLRTPLTQLLADKIVTLGGTPTVTAAEVRMAEDPKSI
jgi:hypothetical protein